VFFATNVLSKIITKDIFSRLRQVEK
jgi:hypothetical protein